MERKEIIAGCTAIGIILLIILGFFCYTTIQPGQIGYKKLFGHLYSQPLQPGLHLKSPLTSIVKLTTKFNQLHVTSSVLTEDNLTVAVGATILFKLSKDKYSYVYSNFGNDIEMIKKTILTPALKSSVRKACATMDWNTLSIHRDQLCRNVSANLKTIVAPKGFTITNVMINDIQPPHAIKNAIMAKLSAQQQVTQMEFEQQKAKKEAEIKITEARGIAKAQEIIQKRLTPLYIQYYAIQTYKMLANSPNTTFVIMPTSTEGAGLPLILNSTK